MGLGAWEPGQQVVARKSWVNTERTPQEQVRRKKVSEARKCLFLFIYNSGLLTKGNWSTSWSLVEIFSICTDDLTSQFLWFICWVRHKFILKSEDASFLLYTSTLLPTAGWCTCRCWVSSFTRWWFNIIFSEIKLDNVWSEGALCCSHLCWVNGTCDGSQLAHCIHIRAGGEYIILSPCWNKEINKHTMCIFHIGHNVKNVTIPSLPYLFVVVVCFCVVFLCVFSGGGGGGGGACVCVCVCVFLFCVFFWGTGGRGGGVGVGAAFKQQLAFKHSSICCNHHTFFHLFILFCVMPIFLYILCK